MKTILFIDDDEGVRSIFASSLREHGYRVLEAASGQAGYELARQQLPDLILTDVCMPGGDGRLVLDRVRHDPDLSCRQVVLMTGAAEVLTPRKGMESGADDFLLKPFSQETLLHCVEARLNRVRMEDNSMFMLRECLPSNLPHEFFTPISGIIGLSEILMGEGKTLLIEEIVSLAGDIHQTGLRLHRTLRNYLMILDLQSTAARKITPVINPLPAKTANKSILAGIKASLHRTKRDEDVVIRLEDSSPLACPVDLALIAEELMDNACNYSKAGTPIKVHLSSNGVFSMTDYGRGMSSDQIERIGAFQQFDRKKYEQQGLGLGLELVQKLAARCSALFSIESKISEGTCVEVAFAIPAQESSPCTSRP